MNLKSHSQHPPLASVMPKRPSSSSIDEELKQLDNQIHTLISKETDFQQIIDDLSKMKNETTKERVGLEKQRKEVQAQNAPINWLPPELLTQIFVAFAASDVEETQYPPVILSHICMKWRVIALSTPDLWSRIILRGSKGAEMTQAFLSRSGDALLEVDFAPLPESLPRALAECWQVRDFIDMVSPHFKRCENLSFQCKTPTSIFSILRFLDDFLNAFPRLQRLELSISTYSPSYLNSSILARDDLPDAQSLPSNSTLRHLVIQRVPPSNLSTGLISNLRKLELSYPSRKKSLSPVNYRLTLSALYDLLSSTPLLEELVLNNTVPALPGPNVDVENPNHDPFPLVKLDYLRSVEWTFPSTVDVPRLLCLLDAPILDRLDLWVDCLSSKPDTHRVNDYPTRLSAHEYICFPSLRDLSIQCNGDESMVCVLRKFYLPVLENVAFTNVDKSARPAVGKEPLLPIFPRLESVFHDPRLRHLTHLTLSHFKISLETSRGETVFGYMPLLTSLSLDSCIGIGILLQSLQETIGVGLTNGIRGVCPSRSVKFCPRLEALSIWGCHDVDFGRLREVVVARNGTAIIPEGGSSAGAVIVPPNGAKAGSIPRFEFKENWPRGQSERKIKPLKLRHTGMTSTPSLHSSTNTLIAMREVMEPADIIYVRVANCRLVTKNQALSLHDLGVVDVIWADSDLTM